MDKDMQVISMLERARSRKDRRRRKRRIVESILAVIAIIALWALLCGGNRQITGYEYITGTSLWDLSRNCPEYMDKRDYIAEIAALNSLDGTIVYADRLYQVPVYE